jgi:hypothetical protein
MAIMANSRLGIIVGTPQGARADEFQRATPILLGKTVRSDYPAESLLSQPLLNDTNIIAKLLVSPEKVFFAILPTDYEFSAIWWYPVFLSCISLYLVFYHKCKDNTLAISAVLIIVFSPGNIWWTYLPVYVLGQIILAGILVVHSQKENLNWSLRFLSLLFAGGLVTASFLTYAPWALAFSLLLGPFALYLTLRERAIYELHLKKKKSILMLSILIPPIYVAIANWNSLSLMSNTTYPGSRVSNGGESFGLQWFFSGIFNVLIVDRSNMKSLNQSEFSLGFAVLILPLTLILLRNIYKRNFILVSSILFGIVPGLLWTFAPIPSEVGFIYNRIPSQRMALALSVAIPLILIYLVFERLKMNEVVNNFSKSLLFLGTIVTLILIIPYVRASVNEVDTPLVFFILLLTAICTVLFFVNSLSAIKYGLFGFLLISVLSSGTVNPIARGTAPFYQVEPFQTIQSTPLNSLWGSENFVGDAYLMASARNSYSGQQLIAPNFQMWELIDPKRIYVDFWNKGASYVLFDWQKINGAKIYSAAEDQINIQINPCGKVGLQLKLDFLVASKQLSEFKCLKQLNVEPFLKPNGPMWIYEVKTP